MNRNSKKMIAAGVLAGMMAMMPVVTVQAEEAQAPATETAEEPDAMTGSLANLQKESSDMAKATTDSSAAKTAEQATEAPQKKLTHTWEVQAEYLEGRFFHDRHIDDYNIHIYQKNREVDHVGVWYGLTLSRPVGYTTEDKIYRDSEAVGLGPSMMLRWERPLAGKLHGSIDGTGSLLFYNQAHPGDGRAFGFLWRIGPRLLYQATDKDAVNLGYLFHHSSNGFKHHNPGYNGVGFSLGWTHSF